MKNQLAITGIRALPMMDPDSGQLTTLDAYAGKLAQDKQLGGSLGEDPIATSYMMLFDSNFLVDEARIIKLQDGRYISLTEAIDVVVSNSDSGLDPEVLKRAVRTAATLHQASRLSNGQHMTKALTSFLFAVSEANASGATLAGLASPVMSPESSTGTDAARPQGTTTAREKTIDLGNGVRMELVLIPPGDFYMGSPADKKYTSGNQGPVRRIRITKSFYMGKFEVTQGQYNAVMGRNPNRFSGRDLPVETVSWLEARQFCEKLSAERGGWFRLPTEAEWEYACRAGSETTYCYGNDPDCTELGEYAWYARNSEKKSHSVGQKRPNQFGLYDMHGNVWEWCSDYYTSTYQNLPSIDPQSPSSGQYRVMRGGSWHWYAWGCWSATRVSGKPDDLYNEYGGPVGFRIVLDLE